MWATVSPTSIVSSSLELDCHDEDDELRQCLREKRRNKEDDDDDDDDNDDAALPWMLAPSLRLRTKEVQSYQQTLGEGSFLPTCHLRSQHSIIVRQAAPERAAWLPAPQLGATSATTSLLPAPSHRLSHHTQS